jgi:hypothetical protein
LIEPLQAGEIRVHVAAAGAAELAPEVREALDRLLELLQKEETEGYGVIAPQARLNYVRSGNVANVASKAYCPLQCSLTSTRFLPQVNPGLR